MTAKTIKNEGVTLIALIVTIIVLIVLARSNNKYAVWRKWNHNKSTRKCI